MNVFFARLPQHTASENSLRACADQHACALIHVHNTQPPTMNGTRKHPDVNEENNCLVALREEELTVGPTQHKALERSHTHTQHTQFRGISPPLLMTGVMNASLFGFNGVTKSIVARLKKKRVENLAMPEILMSSLMSVPAYVAVVTPVERLKVFLITEQHAEKSRGTVRLVRDLGFRGLWQGYSVIVCMRAIGLPSYLASYDVSKRYFLNSLGDESSSSSKLLAYVVFERDIIRKSLEYQRPNVHTRMLRKLNSRFALEHRYMSAGTIAGFTFWLVSYPLDFLKTRRQQASAEGATRITTLVSHIYKNEGGIRAFYRGLVPCLARAGPANAVCFGTVERSKRWLESFEFGSKQMYI